MSFRRTLSLFVLLALVLVPAGMLGGAPAMAMNDHAAMAANQHGDISTAAHPCADTQRPAERKAPDNCCVMTCVAIPAVGGDLAVRAIPSRIYQPLPRMRDPHGLAPEADPPPPRFA